MSILRALRDSTHVGQGALAHRKNILTHSQEIAQGRFFATHFGSWSETQARSQNDLTGVFSMKRRLLVTWFIALGLIAAAEVQTAIREHARDHVAMIPK